ncbi:MAG: sigma-54 dependent transcriptional regulator [Gemmatimonadota bacterium]|nr:sigma-54 dependent transcriptional regulator [Gemmatimonadota bacterium]
MTARLLIVDDEPRIRDALRQVLEFEGHEVRTAGSGGEALTIYPEFRPHLVFLDVKMAGLDGLDTLGRLRDLDPGAVVVMISGHGTIATAVEATRRGAFDFLEKPLDSDRLLVTVRNALERQELEGENRRFRDASESRYAMIGDSPALEAVRDTITRVARADARVLISGENGTGKELVARAIHGSSSRRGRPFVEVNCAAIPSELIESELFGHMKGSFTGAVADRPGKFEQADGGTLFLDEVGDMSLATQAKVLRALQEGVITRIGSTGQLAVDVRVLAATNKDLAAEIAAGRFREDLYYRLNVVPIELPPLRERRGDIPALVHHFVSDLAGKAGVAARTVDDQALKLLCQREWPGNIRELRNAVERLLILARGKVVTASDVSRLLGGAAETGADDASTAAEGSFESFRMEAERNFLAAKLREYDWNVTETARALQMPRSNLYKKIERHGLSRESQ